MVLHSAVPSASRLKLSLESQNVSDSPLFKHFKQFQTFRQQLDEILLLNYTYFLRKYWADSRTKQRSDSIIYRVALHISKTCKEKVTTNPRMGGKNQQCQVKPTEWFWLSKNLSNTEHHCTETANLLHPMTAYQMRNSPTRANTPKHAQTQTHVNTWAAPGKKFHHSNGKCRRYTSRNIFIWVVPWVFDVIQMKCKESPNLLWMSRHFHCFSLEKKIQI